MSGCGSEPDGSPRAQAPRTAPGGPGSDDPTGNVPSREVLEVLAEVYRLLNEYAPVWYSEELHRKLARTVE